MLKDKHRIFLQVNTIVFGGHSQTCPMQCPQNNRFALWLTYLKNEERDEVDFSHADKHQSFLQAIIVFVVIARHA